MPTKLDLKGRQFGRLTVLCEVPTQKAGAYWQCRCACGKDLQVRGTSLSTGHTTSCGCAVKERVATLHTYQKNVLKHGATRVGNRENAYASWRMMHRRCYVKEDANYPHYGGRGILVCARWHDYRNFREDMGPRPAGMTIERQNNDGNYEPGNCVWATPKTQSLNRRSNVLVEYQGRTQPLGAWCDELQMQYQQAYYRFVRCGWDFPEVVKTLTKRP